LALEELANMDATEILRALPARIHQVIDAPAIECATRVALIEDGMTWTYGDLYRSVLEIADDLRTLGIRPGDRLMMVSENCVALAALLLAASRIDAWAIVANPRLTVRELDQIRQHSGARRVLFTVNVSKEAASHSFRYNVQLRGIGPLSGIGVSELNEAALAEPVEQSGAKQVAILIYTSGTTGAPKGVMLTHENLLFSAKSTAATRHVTPHDKLYIALPMSHIVGISLLLITLMSGATARLAGRFDPASLVRAIAEERITILAGVPATYQRLLEYKATAGLRDLAPGSLRVISVVGAPLDLSLKSQVEQELGLSLLNGYGTTECSPGISGVRPNYPRCDQAVGTLLPGIEAKIVGPDGVPAAKGCVGELYVRGRNVMRGYYREPELTSKAIDSNGWYNTGDLARLDGDCLFIVGRTKELIIRSGFNVYPAEVEAVLNSHHAVVQSAVIGRSVAGNEEVVAFVQLLPDSTTSIADLTEYVRSQLTAYKQPSEIIVLEALPANSAGKILKHKLAESLSR
jgi:long-chain acyl-CoA synthetase